MRRRAIVGFVGPSLALVLAGACGGSVFDAHGGGAGGSSGSAGQSGASGGSGFAGAQSGAGGGSGVSGASGAAGAGGALDPRCSLPLAPGGCDAIFPSWWHDPATGVCKPFSYGGCDGNANRFASREECLATCRGGNPNLDACSQPSDCVVVPAGCCGACEPVDERALISVNRQFQNSLVCPGVACAACPPPAGPFTGKYFVPTCEAGQCTVVDLRQNDLTACTFDSDCTLRAGSDCCGNCEGRDIIALNKNADLVGLVCGTGGVSCVACAPFIPPGYSTSCSGGQCVVHEPPCTIEHPCPL